MAKSGVLVLDLDKAFDSLEWPYLFAALRRFGFPDIFLGQVHLLYFLPSARVRIGRRVSREFRVRRGTRQGCPLSPLLFALAMEPLAIALRREGRDWGLSIGEETHVVSLYADDLLIYVNNISVTQYKRPRVPAKNLTRKAIAKPS